MILWILRAVDLIAELRGLADQAVFSDRTVMPGIEYIQLPKKCKKKSVRGSLGGIVHETGSIFLSPPRLFSLFHPE
jgi:hypothetical protein